MTTNSATEGSQPSIPADGSATAVPAEQTSDAESSSATPAEAGDPAQSGEKPDAQKSTEQPKLADALRNVLDESRKKSAKADDGSPPDPKAQGKDAEAAKTASETDATAADGEKPPPFHNHPRWKKLQENYAKEKQTATEHATKLKELEPFAEIGRNFSTFRDANGLTDKDVEYGQGLMALMKTKPEDALAVLDDLRTQLSIHLGKELPKDLHEAVEKGEITEAYAKQLHTERTGRKASETQQRESEAAKAERETKEVETARKTAITNWFTEQRTKDPDFSKIKALVTDRLTALAQARLAKDQTAVTAKEARELATKALADVKAQLKGLVPGKPAVEPKRTETSSPGSGSSQAGTAPKTMLDVTRSVLAQTRG